jgi:hypothetical protein
MVDCFDPSSHDAARKVLAILVISAIRADKVLYDGFGEELGKVYHVHGDQPDAIRALLRQVDMQPAADEDPASDA